MFFFICYDKIILMAPLISVVMSTYNRESIVSETIESILNQTYRDFEYIIIDDCSLDNTYSVIKNFNDHRIKLYRNNVNRGCTFNYHIAHNLAKGKYIIHTDDDDISSSYRFDIQLNYMKEHPDIKVLGTFMDTFGETASDSWVKYCDDKILDFVMNLYNPMCHSSIMYDKTFADENNINYNLNYFAAQDYELYKQVLFKGGKLANVGEKLIKYRMHKKRITDITETQKIQKNNAFKIKRQLLSRFLSEDEVNKVMELLINFPYNDYKMSDVEEAFKIMKSRNEEVKKFDSNVIDLVFNDIKNQYK